MKWVVSLYQKEQEEKILAGLAQEVLVGIQNLGRLGRLTWEEGMALGKQIRSQGKRAVLVWDILMSEEILKEVGSSLSTLDFSSFSAIRIQDPGALFWVQQNCPWKKFQLILEHGNHNLSSLRGWIELAGANLQRVILSPQIPREKLKDFIALAKSYGVETELLALGPLLLFYSPRHLVGHLSPGGVQRESDLWEVKGDSLESPHRGFSIVENSRGTFMFHPKDLSLVEFLVELEEMGLSAVRFDLLNDRPVEVINSLHQVSHKSEEMKEVLAREYPHPVMKGFYQGNKSHILFKKLKNQNTRERGEHYLGEVVAIEKKNYIAIHLQNPRQNLHLNDILEYRTPEGRKKISTVTSLQNCEGEECTELPSEEIALVNPIGGISPKTAVYSTLGELS